MNAIYTDPKGEVEHHSFTGGWDRPLSPQLKYDALPGPDSKSKCIIKQIEFLTLVDPQNFAPPNPQLNDDALPGPVNQY